METWKEVLSVLCTVVIFLYALYAVAQYIHKRKSTFRNPAVLSQIVLILGAIVLLVFIFNSKRVEFRTGEAYGKGFAIVGATLLVYFALKGLEQSKDKTDNSKKDEGEIERQSMFVPTVDKDKCIGCGECIEVCPVEVFELEDEKAEPVNAEECLGCEDCVEVCEQEAVTVEET